jgi:hypothetical protein
LENEGEWAGKTNGGYEHQFLLTDEQTGKPLPNRYYQMTFNGKVAEGNSDAEGKTEKQPATRRAGGWYSGGPTRTKLACTRQAVRKTYEVGLSYATRMVHHSDRVFRTLYPPLRVTSRCCLPTCRQTLVLL